MLDRLAIAQKGIHKNRSFTHDHTLLLLENFPAMASNSLVKANDYIYIFEQLLLL